MLAGLARRSSAAAFFMFALAAKDARADWPTGRHDPQRTGVASSPSNITVPAAYWRAYLGGAIGTGAIVLGDADGDGKEDVLLVADSELKLVRPDGGVLWRTGYLGLAGIDAVTDLDGDGILDVVVHATTHAFVVNAKTGMIEWQEAANELGTVAEVRVGDLDGDGKPDLWLDTCGCCAIEVGSPGVVYSFANGFGAPSTLPSPPARSHCGADSDTLGDFDGDGVLDLAVADNSTMTFTRADGTLLGVSGSLGAQLPSAQCEPVVLGAATNDALICYENTSSQRSLFLVSYNSATSPPVQLVWSKTLSPSDIGDARRPVRLTADLAGDGTLQAIASGNINGDYTTYVVDAATGADLASIPARTAVATMPRPQGGGEWIITTGASGDVAAYAYQSSPPAVAPVWSLSDRNVALQRDWAALPSSVPASALVTTDLNADAKPELVLQSQSEPTVIAGYDVSAGSPQLLTAYTVDAGVSAVALGTSISNSVPKSSLFVSRNDGYVALLDATFKTTNQQPDGLDILPGLQAGGFLSPYIAPVAAKLKPTDIGASVLVSDSRGDTIRLDTSTATNVAPAKALWRVADSMGPAIVPASSSAASIGILRRRHPLTDPPVWTLSVLDADGKEVGSSALPRPGFHDVLPGDFAGNGDVGFATLDLAASGTDIIAVDSTGAQLWSQPVPAGGGLEPMSVADWNADGADDVIVARNQVYIYDGVTGAVIASGGGPLAYFLPIVSELPGTSSLDLVLQGGYDPVYALSHDLATPLWKSSDVDLPYVYGSLASCGGAAVLVEGSFADPPRLSIVKASGAGAGSSSTIVLASGTLYADDASALAAGATLGQLGNVAVSTNLDGSNAGPTALVSSSDGYLYAVDPCQGTLLWSKGFGFPAGDPILADTDGDGQDEIILPVGDGYLYALKQQLLPAPAFVWDTDPPDGIDDKDIDQINTLDTLYAKWAPVAGASSYEVAVVGSSGTYLTTPSWVAVGDVTEAAISNLPLVDGGKYFVGVRGVSAAGKGPDAPSNGVIVTLKTTQATTSGAGGSGGAGGSMVVGSSHAAAGVGGSGSGSGDLLSGRACTCRLSDDRSNGGWVAALLGLALARARRSRSRRTPPRRDAGRHA